VSYEGIVLTNFEKNIKLIIMKKILFTILATIFSYYIQAQNFEWAKTMGGSGNDDFSRSIAVDNSGNVYTTGYFNGIADFDPGIGTYNLTWGGYHDIFISKLDNNGDFVWAKRIGGASTDMGYSIAIDLSGNVYTTGYFNGTVDFDPGAGTANLTSNGGSDIFISKLDSNGNYVWAKNMGSNSSDIGNSLAIDASGNVYSTGTFSGTADFDPGTGTFNLTSVGNVDIFISKLDSNGNFVWAKNIGGTSEDIAYSVTIDASDNVYTTGHFSGTADFDPNLGVANLISAGGYDIFVSKLDSNGNFVWAKNMGGNSNDIGYSIVTDIYNNVHFSGYFQGTSDFDPGLGVMNLTSAGGYDIFISKLDSNGNLLWVKSMGANSSDYGLSLTLDISGNVYTTGFYLGTVDFNPGVGVFNLTSQGSQDIFISKLDANGNFIWAKSMGGVSTDYGYAITLDASENIYTTGDFRGTADFDPGVGVFNLTGAGNVDIFVQKMSQCNISSGYSFVYNGNYSFTNTSSGNFNQSHWSFGDGNTSTSINPNHTFSANGTFIVVLTVNDSVFNGNCFDYFIDTITVSGVVSPAQCAAGFVMYPDTSTGNITVVNSSTGSNLTYLWNFGDGNTSTLQNPNHTYSTAGPFYLCLTVDDGNSCIDTYCDSIGSNGVVFKQTGFTINVISPPIITGINNTEKIISEITIYPNPTSNQLIIDSEQKINEISIIDITGKTLKVYTTSLNSINVSDLPSGIYFIKLITNENTITKKLIKE
jgi:PKD repeat protein